MQMRGERHIAAPREAIWAALNDLAMLRACIPGCDKLERVDQSVMGAEVTAKVGQVATRFRGTLTMSDVDPPNGYTLSGNGQGGAAGFATGRARVQLVAEDNGTTLTYHVDATVGGKLAQVGSRLIDAAARKMADDFFQRLQMQLEPAQTAAPADEPERSGLRPLYWAPLLIAFVLIILYVFSRL